MGKGNYPRKGFSHWVSFDGQGVYENPIINTDGETKKINGFMTDILSDAAMDWLGKDRDKPFCLYLSHKAIHGPFTPAPRHEHLYDGAKLPTRRTASTTSRASPTGSRRAGSRELASMRQVTRELDRGRSASSFDAWLRRMRGSGGF